MSRIPAAALVGTSYGKLQVLSITRQNRFYQKYVLARCDDCGNEREYRLSDVRAGKITSCGCWHEKHDTSSIDTLLESACPEPNTGCWLWQGSRSGRAGDDGRGEYGKVNFKGIPDLAHRVAWELAYGPIPDGDGYHGTCVCHTCDTPICIWPGHLWLGTHADNVADRDAKGRTSRGVERISNAKLTESQVVRVRTVYKKGGVSKRWLADRYGVHIATIDSILSGRTWKHLLVCAFLHWSATSVPQTSETPTILAVFHVTTLNQGGAQ